MHDRLHGVGRVGAQHQHLAVGHVDDAQEAEGDRQAERREQQHAGQRQAVQQIADEADHALVLTMASRARAGRGADARVRLVRLAVVPRRQHLLQRREEVVVAALADHLQRPQPDVRIGARQIDARDRQRQRLAHLAVVLAVQRPVKQHRRLRVAAVRELLGRRQPNRRVRRTELELRQYGSDHPPDLVADLDLLQGPRLRRDHLTGDRIPEVAGLRVPDVRVPVGPEPQALVAERVQRRDRPRIVEHSQLGDALCDLVVRGGRQPVDCGLKLRFAASSRGPA